MHCLGICRPIFSEHTVCAVLSEQDKYCYRQAELGVGDCGGLRFIPGRLCKSSAILVLWGWIAELLPGLLTSRQCTVDTAVQIVAGFVNACTSCVHETNIYCNASPARLLGVSALFLLSGSSPCVLTKTVCTQPAVRLYSICVYPCSTCVHLCYAVLVRHYHAHLLACAMLLQSCPFVMVIVIQIRT
jgi:hypothetical protein